MQGLGFPLRTPTLRSEGGHTQPPSLAKWGQVPLHQAPKCDIQGCWALPSITRRFIHLAHSTSSFPHPLIHSLPWGGGGLGPGTSLGAGLASGPALSSWLLRSLGCRRPGGSPRPPASCCLYGGAAKQGLLSGVQSSQREGSREVCPSCCLLFCSLRPGGPPQGSCQSGAGRLGRGHPCGAGQSGRAGLLEPREGAGLSGLRWQAPSPPPSSSAGAGERSP